MILCVRYDIVFQHFPMRKLMENPGVWTLLSYKYGRLIVKDSNELEWIYIIKSVRHRYNRKLIVVIVFFDSATLFVIM